MKDFSPRKYLEGEINQENCKHQVLVGDAFDEGERGLLKYDCLICGKKLVQTYNGLGTSKDLPYLDEVHVELSAGCLTPGIDKFIRNKIVEVCLENLHEDLIDIVELMNKEKEEIKAKSEKLALKRLKRTDNRN